MKVGFNLTRLDDRTILKMRADLKIKGIEMGVVVRESERYLCLEAEDLSSALERLDDARHYYKSMSLEAVFWDEEMGEFISEARLRVRLGLDDGHDAWDHRNDRDPLSGDDGRADY